MFKVLIVTFLISLSISIIIIFLENFFKNFGLDEKIFIQKIHKENALRIGSIPIIFSFIIVSVLYLKYNILLIILLISLLPVIFIGLYEDIFRNQSISIRFSQ